MVELMAMRISICDNEVSDEEDVIDDEEVNDDKDVHC